MENLQGCQVMHSPNSLLQSASVDVRVNLGHAPCFPSEDQNTKRAW